MRLLLLIRVITTHPRGLLRDSKFVPLFNTRTAEGTVNGHLPNGRPLTSIPFRFSVPSACMEVDQFISTMQSSPVFGWLCGASGILVWAAQLGFHNLLCRVLGYASKGLIAGVRIFPKYRKRKLINQRLNLLPSVSLYGISD